MTTRTNQTRLMISPSQISLLVRYSIRQKKKTNLEQDETCSSTTYLDCLDTLYQNISNHILDQVFFGRREQIMLHKNPSGPSNTPSNLPQPQSPIVNHNHYCHHASINIFWKIYITQQLPELKYPAQTSFTKCKATAAPPCSLRYIRSITSSPFILVSFESSTYASLILLKTTRSGSCNAQRFNLLLTSCFRHLCDLCRKMKGSASFLRKAHDFFVCGRHDFSVSSSDIFLWLLGSVPPVCDSRHPRLEA